MGVYIKGMEMPESCVLCRLECLYRVHNSVSRSKYCPLVEVKTPHGRLIDEEMIVSVEGQMKADGTVVGFTDVDAPTVIEAEAE